MNIKRFDKIEFRVLLCADPRPASFGGGFIPDDPYKERALLLMKEGIIKDNPVSNWWNTGWELSEKGIKYWDKFLEKLRENHGHTWMTNYESDRGYYDADSKYGKQINWFALEANMHNGPRCKKCGFDFCHHCTSEFEVEKCTK